MASRLFLSSSPGACVCQEQSSHCSQPFSAARSPADSSWSMLLRSTTTVVYCSIANLVSTTNKALIGFAEFLEGLGEANIPAVPVTTRSRLQFDATIRKFGLGHPFLRSEEH